MFAILLMLLLMCVWQVFFSSFIPKTFSQISMYTPVIRCCAIYVRGVRRALEMWSIWIWSIFYEAVFIASAATYSWAAVNCWRFPMFIFSNTECLALHFFFLPRLSLDTICKLSESPRSLFKPRKRWKWRKKKKKSSIENFKIYVFRVGFWLSDSFTNLLRWLLQTKRRRECWKVRFARTCRQL